MVGKIEIEITKKPGTIAQYITIPRDIVMDRTYPLDRDAESQIAHMIIDDENKTLIIKKGPLPPDK